MLRIPLPYLLHAKNPCRNQTGWGKESADGRTEEPSPVYWWNNTRQDGTALSFSYDINPWFLSNRDYCNHSPGTVCGAKAAWTYTAYPYPHPLQNGTSTSPKLPAPTNLRAVS